jgi:hypothetical protein
MSPGNQLGRSADTFAQAAAHLLVPSSRLEVLGLDCTHACAAVQAGTLTCSPDNELGEEHVARLVTGLPTCPTLRHVLLHGNSGRHSPAGVALGVALRARK